MYVFLPCVWSVTYVLLPHQRSVTHICLPRVWSVTDVVWYCIPSVASLSSRNWLLPYQSTLNKQKRVLPSYIWHTHFQYSYKCAQIVYTQLGICLWVHNFYIRMHVWLKKMSESRKLYKSFIWVIRIVNCKHTQFCCCKCIFMSTIHSAPNEIWSNSAAHVTVNILNHTRMQHYRFGWVRKDYIFLTFDHLRLKLGRYIGFYTIYVPYLI